FLTSRQSFSRNHVHLGRSWTILRSWEVILPLRHAVDVRLYSLYGKKGSGKSTLAVSFAIAESLSNGRAPIISNMRLSIPGIETIQRSKIKDLIQECN